MGRTPGVWVTYSYCVSLLVVSWRLRSSPVFVPDGTSRITPGLPYTLISVVFGWWGFPWGLLYTPMAVVENLSGGTPFDAEEGDGGLHDPLPVRDTMTCPACGSTETTFVLGRSRCLSCRHVVE
ncbi:MAG: hypothetical protein M3Y87_36360 [Myxococcota bacterium]|nr:hypothetical protein [Myxococcota bacterium]